MQLFARIRPLNSKGATAPTSSPEFGPAWRAWAAAVAREAAQAM
jgi:hypothetical protein